MIPRRPVLLALLCVMLIMSASALAQTTRRKAAPRPAARSQSEALAAFEQLKKRALDAKNANRLEEAVGASMQALQIKPDWAEGWWLVGTIFYDQDRYDEAREALRRLVVIQPRSGDAWALLGLCDYQVRDYEKALNDLQRARSFGFGGSKELVAVVQYHTAILLNRFEQYELAYDVLRGFAAEQNDHPRIIEAMGTSILRMPFLPPEIPPDKHEMVMMAGRAAFAHAALHIQEAAAAFEELVRRYPDTPNVHYAYGVFLLKDKPDQAIAEFRRELELSPKHVPALLQIAFEYIRRSDYQSARPVAEQAVKLAPYSFASHNALGRVLLETGDVRGAVTELELGVKYGPEIPEMRFALARAYQRAGRKEDAARERAEFTRLDKVQREKREGPQAVGGIQDKQPE